ncbi:MAG: hypothetical protein V6Z86_07225 [Hyphomicrobiales bacterium]
MDRVDFVTTSRERTDFSVQARIGDIIELAGLAPRVGRSSLSVQIDMVAETPSSGECRSCSHGLFNMVAIGLESTDGVLPSLRNIAAARGDCGLHSVAVEIVFFKKTGHYGDLYSWPTRSRPWKSQPLSRASRRCRKTMAMAGLEGADLTASIQNGSAMIAVPRVVGGKCGSVSVEMRRWVENPHDRSRTAMRDRRIYHGGH